jgi:hypothetical protein
MEPHMTAPPYESTQETYEETRPDGTTIKKTTRSRRIDTADIALLCVFVLCAAIFVMSIFIHPMREQVSGALMPLLGVFTLAVGGITAFRVFMRPAGHS